MRSLFLLLALANVALLMWEYDKATQPMGLDSVTPLSTGRQSIILQWEQQRKGLDGGSDRPADPFNRSQENPVPPAADTDADTSAEQADSLFCYEAGPFADPEKIALWQRPLTALGVEAKQFAREERVVKDYLVFYPAGETPEQMQASLEMLRTAGYEDAWLLNEEDRQRDISLGVFKQESAALSMKKQMIDKGLKVGVTSRYKTQRRLYVLISGSSQLQAKIEALAGGVSALLAKPQSYCKDDPLP